MMVLFMMLSAISLLPETSHAFSKPFLVLWLRFKKYQKSFLSKPEKKNSSKFWVIDMTKFEP
jgi:hypothetical protein